MGNKIRKVRQFSTDFKKDKVKQMNDGKITILQLSRIYEVSSTAVYKWIRKYSRYAGQIERVVVQKAESRGQRAEGKGQRAEGKGQRTKSEEQRARAVGSWQKQRADYYKSNAR